MRFYKATSFLFPRHYPARMFALCFGAVHIPLVTFLVFEALRGEWHWGIFLALLVATVVGSVAAILGIHGLLAPIDEASRALRAMRDGDLSRPVPIGGPDLAGHLLESVAHASRSTADKIDNLQELANTDLLTGLLNRRGFFEALDARENMSGTLAVIDTNNFKRVNDLHGHLEGDRVLRMMGERIREVMSGDDAAARWGGDEFLVYFADRSEDDAAKALEALAQGLIRRPLTRIDGKPFGFSSGTTALDEADRGLLDAAVARADEPLYRDKRRARGLVDA